MFVEKLDDIDVHAVVIKFILFGDSGTKFNQSFCQIMIKIDLKNIDIIDYHVDRLNSNTNNQWIIGDDTAHKIGLSTRLVTLSVVMCINPYLSLTKFQIE